MVLGAVPASTGYTDLILAVALFFFVTCLNWNGLRIIFANAFLS